jgi:cyclopropane fatty-acyl-phospholipid synthase-like methyltransferase
VTLPSQSKIEFEPEEFALCYPPGIENHYWTAARNRIVEHQLRAAGLEQPCILEIGCGKGVVILHLRKKGYSCRGVELANVAPIESVKDFVYTGVSATELTAAEREPFNTLLLLDVIEHLPDPVGFLSTLKAAFPNVSRMIITVPARTELWSNYDRFYGHHRRYDLDSLREVIDAIGGTALCLQYFFRILYLPARLTLALRHRRPVRIRAPRSSMKAIHYLISQVCLADFFLLPRRIWGTSIICTVQW